MGHIKLIISMINRLLVGTKMRINYNQMEQGGGGFKIFGIVTDFSVFYPTFFIILIFWHIKSDS